MKKKLKSADCPCIQENDRRKIAEKYMRMTVEEIEQEKKRMLEEIKAKQPVQPTRPFSEIENGNINF